MGLGTSLQQLAEWFREGVANDKDYMIVVRDMFDHEDYPVYTRTEGFWAQYAAYDRINMQRIVEVYDLRKPWAEQSTTSRVFNTPPQRAAAGRLERPAEIQQALEKRVTELEKALEVLRGEVALHLVKSAIEQPPPAMQNRVVMRYEPFRVGERPDGWPVEYVAASDYDALLAQLPKGMKHCTILFEECPAGHGSLRGANWIKHECPWCRIKELEEDLKQLQEILDDARKSNYEFECARLITENTELKRRLENVIPRGVACICELPYDLTVPGGHHNGACPLRK